MRYSHRDAPGSRLVAETKAASLGRSKLKTCRHCRHQPALTTNYRDVLSGLSNATLRVAQPNLRCESRVTRDYTPANSLISGSRSPRWRPQSMRLPHGWLLTSGCGRSPYCVRCTQSPLQTSPNYSTRTAHLRSRLNSMRTHALRSRALRLRKSQLVGEKVSGSNTSSGTR